MPYKDRTTGSKLYSYYGTDCFSTRANRKREIISPNQVDKFQRLFKE